MACAAVALLTIASSATEELAQQSHAHVSSVSSLEARVEADAKSAAVKDASAQTLQAQLIKYAIGPPPHASFQHGVFLIADCFISETLKQLKESLRARPMPVSS
jgi:hypothetical protein